MALDDNMQGGTHNEHVDAGQQSHKDQDDSTQGSKGGQSQGASSNLGNTQNRSEEDVEDAAQKGSEQ